MPIEFLMLGALLGFVIFLTVGYAIDRSHMARDIKEIKNILSGKENASRGMARDIKEIKIILSRKEKDDQTSDQG